MKKKIVAILLCVLIVSTLSISLVACNDSEEQTDPVIAVGSWVGYKQGDDSVQYFMEFKKAVNANTGKDGIYIKTYLACIVDDQIIIKTTSSAILGGSVTKFPNEEKYRLDIALSENEIKNNSPSKHIGMFINQELHVEYSDTLKYVFKKTDLNLERWQEKAFVNMTDPEGHPIVDDDGEYIYIPYFFEQ